MYKRSNSISNSISPGWHQCFTSTSLSDDQNVNNVDFDTALDVNV
jgi:hypothetical protein